MHGLEQLAWRLGGGILLVGNVDSILEVLGVSYGVGMSDHDLFAASCEICEIRQNWISDHYFQL